MPLNIDRVDARIHVGATRDPQADAAPRAANGAATDEEIRDRIRSVVIEILEQELTRFQRQQG